MDLKTYVKALKACTTASPPDLDNEDSCPRNTLRGLQRIQCHVR